MGNGKRIGLYLACFHACCDVGGEAVEHFLVAEYAPDGLVLASADLAEGVFDEDQSAFFLQTGKALLCHGLASLRLVALHAAACAEERRYDEQCQGGQMFHGVNREIIEMYGAKIRSFSGISKFLFQKTCITEAGTILTDDASLELHIYTHIFFTNTLTAAKIGETGETE